MNMRVRSARKNAAPAPSARPRRDGPPAAHARAARRPPAGPLPSREAAERARDAGPQDRALYGCQCGTAFRAPVSASVRCPRCGDTQAW